MDKQIENNLLLLCCRELINGDKGDEIKDILKKDLDWDIVLERARKDNLSPLLYYSLKRINGCFKALPPYAAKELKRYYYYTSARNTFTYNELSKILKRLGDNGIDTILLKGAALAEVIYDEISLRPMTDVDLLIKREDFKKTNEILNTLGFKAKDRAPDIYEAIFSSYLNTFDYTNSGGMAFSLHLHWHLINSTIPTHSYIHKINMDKIWRDADQVSISGSKTMILSPHHFIIHLSEHALRVRHSLNRLIFLLDISKTIQRFNDRLDWEKLIKESYEFNLHRMVYQALHLNKIYMATQSLPEYVIDRLRPARLSLGERIFMAYALKGKYPTGLSYTIHLSMNENFFQKIRFIYRTIFPPIRIVAQRGESITSRFKISHYIFRIIEVFSHILKGILNRRIHRGNFL
ncbi:MAG: nucleotidyltransferase family protein [Nitrospinota bacterium]